MKKKYFLILVVLFAVRLSYGQMFGQTPEERERTYDVENISINVKLDLEKKIVEGKVVTEFRPLVDNFTQFEVDAVGMKIKSVKQRVFNATNDPKLAEKFEDLKFDYDNQKIKVYLKGQIAKGFSFKYQVEYTTINPEKGLYFISPLDERPNRPYQVWTQGEGEDNRYWFPCYDYPNDKSLTETYITVGKQYQTLSNGKMVDAVDNPDGTKTWHWKLNHPHSSYLVMIAVGNWDIAEDNWNGIPIQSYVPKGFRVSGLHAFGKTADMTKVFSEAIGFNYPWDKYAQVVVEDFIYGGMENTSATVLTDVSVYDEKIPPDYDATGLVAHELAHMWWGDVLTCKNWNEIWTNEGFATFFAKYYREIEKGKDEYDYSTFREGEGVLRVSRNWRVPIWARHGSGTNTYSKGSYVLSMLRYVMGEERFWKAMNIYITKNQFQPVTTQNLVEAVNEALNPANEDHKPMDMQWFFDEWIYKAGEPEYEVSYIYDDFRNHLVINARQIQMTDSSTVFRTPVEIGVLTDNKMMRERIEVADTMGQYVYVMEEKPQTVIFNLGNKVLSRVKFTKPKEDWLYQMKNSLDAIDRITAINGVKEFINDDEMIEALKNRMMYDEFWGTRWEAAEMLANTDKDYYSIYMEAYSREQDSRIRRQMLTGFGKLKSNASWKANPRAKDLIAYLQSVIQLTTSVYEAGDAIEAIGKICEKNEIYDLITPYFNRDSHNETIRKNILTALKGSDDKRCKDIFIQYSSLKYQPRMRDNAFGGLEKFLNEPGVIDYLNKSLDDQFRSTRMTIIGLLEKGKSSSSKPYLEALRKKSGDEELKKRIKEAMDKL